MIDADAYVREAAAALGLDLDDQRRAMVAAALVNLLEMAATMDAVDLAPEDEPASRFIP